MKITIIGGSGFIGTRIIDHLKDVDGYEFSIVDLKRSHFFGPLTTIGDVRNQVQMDQALRGTDMVILLAAQHRDDVTPVSLYYETNVGGMRVTLKAMERNGVKRLLFMSSVAVYGIDKDSPDEGAPKDPFNHYGKSKWQAEQILQEWHTMHADWNINVIRPTVTFGERNRGNVYNLLHQIQSGRFMMVGKGRNKKSMAYVGNLVAFVQFLTENYPTSYNVFNYVDQPDYTMNDLIEHVETVLDRRLPAIRLPYGIGMLGGYCFDFVAWLTRRKLTISAVRVKKFCASTEYDATKMHQSGFKAPYTLGEGLARTLEFEFIHPRPDSITFETE